MEVAKKMDSKEIYMIIEKLMELEKKAIEELRTNETTRGFVLLNSAIGFSILEIMAGILEDRENAE